MPHYLLSVCYPADAQPPAPEELQVITADVMTLDERMRAAAVWVFGTPPTRTGHGFWRSTTTCRQPSPSSTRWTCRATTCSTAAGHRPTDAAGRRVTSR